MVASHRSGLGPWGASLLHFPFSSWSQRCSNGLACKIWSWPLRLVFVAVPLFISVTTFQARIFMKDLVLALEPLLGLSFVPRPLCHVCRNFAATGFLERFGLGPLGSCLLQFLFSSRSQHSRHGFPERFGLGRWGQCLLHFPFL